MKKLIFLLLSLAFVFAFISCDDDGDDDLPKLPMGEVFEDENGDTNLPIINYK